MKRLNEQRTLAVLLGIAIMVIVVLQILKDGFRTINNPDTQTKTDILR